VLGFEAQLGELIGVHEPYAFAGQLLFRHDAAAGAHACRSAVNDDLGVRLLGVGGLVDELLE